MGVSEKTGGLLRKGGGRARPTIDQTRNALWIAAIGGGFAHSRSYPRTSSLATRDSLLHRKSAKPRKVSCNLGNLFYVNCCCYLTKLLWLIPAMASLFPAHAALWARQRVDKLLGLSFSMSSTYLASSAIASAISSSFCSTVRARRARLICILICRRAGIRDSIVLR
jgi:hypothetical protein